MYIIITLIMLAFVVLVIKYPKKEKNYDAEMRKLKKERKKWQK